MHCFFSKKLDGLHVVFGKLVEGRDVVMAIESHGSLIGKPDKPIMITSSGLVEDEISMRNRRIDLNNSSFARSIFIYFFLP